MQRRYASGTIVFSEGEACAGLYVVESGQIRIFKTSSDGREQVLSIDGPGSSVGELPVLRTMRAASNGYAVPAEACVSYQALYRALAEFEADLHQHIHLENNILFPRAIAMERTAA